MVCDEIKQYLASNEIPQTELAQKIGMSKQLLNNKLTGDTRISIEEYVEICDALNVEYAKFVKPNRHTNDRKSVV